MLAAIAYLASNRWFGAGDLSAMAVWSLPLGAIAALVSLPLGSTPKNRRALLRYLLPLVGGPLVGISWTYFAALLLGGWIGAFSFPVLFCWVFAATCGLTLAAWLPQRSTWPWAATLLAVSIVALGRANAYASAPEPRVTLYLKPGATPDEVQQVWETVVGRPSSTGQGHDLLPGISGVGASGYLGDQAMLTVSFWKGTRKTSRDSVIALILQSPLVQRIEPVPETDTSGVRTSVSY